MMLTLIESGEILVGLALIGGLVGIVAYSLYELFQD